MTEKFNLAANVLLSRRLQNLLRIDENVEIDMSYITCAEYQLFIDEKLKAGECRQPDHWTSYRFPPGDAKKPITGVRANDAQEFCEWLTQQQSVLEFKYRLPTLAEIEEYPATGKQLECWCFGGEQRIIVGAQVGQQQTWQQNLAEVLDINLDLYHDLYRDLYHDLNRNLDLNLDRSLDLNLDLNLDRNLNLNLDLNRDLKLYHDLDRVLNFDLNRVLEHDFDRNLYILLYLYPILKLNFNLDLNRDLNRDLKLVPKLVLKLILKLNLNRVLKRDFNLNYRYRGLNLVLKGKINEIEAGKAGDFLLLYFSLLPIMIIYHFLSATYKIISKNKVALNTIKLSRQESEAISRKYLENLNKISPLYVYLVLLDERQAGRMPAWESIRIVRERVE